MPLKVKALLHIASFKETFENQGGEISKLRMSVVTCPQLLLVVLKKIFLNTPDAKVIYDKFHVIKNINEQVNNVRKAEVKENDDLKGTRFI